MRIWLSRSQWARPAVCIFLFALCASTASAQEARGTIQGTVFDSTGAVVPNASITANSVATNVNIKATSNEQGAYNIQFLLPGMYTISAGAAGFKTGRREGIELRIADRLQIDFTLEVGAVNEEVRVTAEAPLLQTATANLGMVVDTKRLSDLPIAHGSPFNLMFLATGVVETSGWGRTWQETSNLDGLSDYVSFNGTPSATSEWTIDGSPNVQSSHGTGPMNSPPADIVQEFKLETAFDASVGHTSGTIVNVSIKTGGNSPHGTASGFSRNPDWDANSFFGNKAGQQKPTYGYKRYGATLTGPVYIPGIFNGKDRTFFSYAYEGVHRSESYPVTGTMPDPKHLTGDFSGLLALGPQYQIYDPATITPAANGRYAIQPFPGNIVPSGRINPISKNIASHFTTPNTTGRPDTINNWTLQTISDPDTYYNHGGRIDHNIGQNNRLFGRFTFMKRVAGPYRNYYDDPAMANNFIGRTKQLTIDDVHTLSPSLILNIRGGVSRFRSGHSPRALGYDPADLGFSPAVTALLTQQGPRFPRIDVSGLQAIGFETDTNLNTTIYYLMANLNKQHGSHNLKFGTDIRSNQGINAGFGQKGGRLIFGTDFTRGPFDNSASSPSGIGQGTAALLLGQPTSGLVDRNDNQAITSSYWSFFVHDNWRATQKLSLDFGVRWEYEGPITERYNRSVGGFDPTASQPIEASARAAYALNPDPALSLSQFNVRGGLLFAGVGGQPRLLWERSLKNFVPRLGFAYQANQKTVVRGGFGLFPISLGQATNNYAILTGFSQATNLIPTLDSGLNFVADLNNPFPDGLLKAPGASLGAQTFLGRGVSFYNPIARTPYTMQWSLNTQTLLPGQFLVEVGYSASKSVKLRTTREFDGIPLDQLSTSFTRDQAKIDYLTAQVANPFAGLLPGTGLTGTKIARSQLLLPFPQFTSVAMRDYQGYSWYHSLQARAERRFSRGVTIQATYTFSKNMQSTEYLNAADPVPYETISNIDRPHLVTFSGLYELPIGKGKAIGTGFSGLSESLLGGWQLGAIWQFQSGFPIGFGDAIFTGNLADIPLSGSQRTAERWFNTDAGFERDSRKARQLNVRSFPLRFSGIRTGIHNSWDISLLKDFRIHESHRAEFRAEFYNAFNNATGFMPPNSDPYSSAFGQVTSQWGLPRQIQFGFKYIF